MAGSSVSSSCPRRDVSLTTLPPQVSRLLFTAATAHADLSCSTRDMDTSTLLYTGLGLLAATLGTVSPVTSIHLPRAKMNTISSLF